MIVGFGEDGVAETEGIGDEVSVGLLTIGALL